MTLVLRGTKFHILLKMCSRSRCKLIARNLILLWGRPFLSSGRISLNLRKILINAWKKQKETTSRQTFILKLNPKLNKLYDFCFVLFCFLLENTYFRILKIGNTQKLNPWILILFLKDIIYFIEELLISFLSIIKEWKICLRINERIKET